MFDFNTQADKILLGSREYNITNVRLIKDCFEDGNIVGTAVAKKLTFEIDADVEMENQEFSYLCGFMIDREMVYTSLGTFISIDVERGDTTKLTSVTALDTMLRFNIPYVSQLDYDGEKKPTLLQVLEECCQLCGVALHENLILPNGEKPIDSNQFTDGQTCREVIKAIGQINGMFAQVIGDELVFTLENMGDDVQNPAVLTPYLYETLELRQPTDPIDTVVLRNSQVEGENVTWTAEQETGPTADRIQRSKTGESRQSLLVIEDNPFAYNQDKRQIFIQALFEQVNGFSYLPFESKGMANPLLNCGDPITVMTIDGTLHSSRILRMEYCSPGGVNSILAAPSITKSTVSYQYTPKVEERVRRTEIIVNKATGEIQSLAQMAGVVSDRADAAMDLAQTNATLITQTAEEIKLAMSISGGSNLLKGTSGRVGLQDWMVQGEASGIIDVSSETTAGGYISVGDGLTHLDEEGKRIYDTVSQSIRMVAGKTYAYYFKYRLTAMSNGSHYVNLAGREIILQASESWLEEKGVLIAQNNGGDVTVGASGCRLDLADLIVIEGLGVSVWQQHPNEIVTSIMVVDDRGATWERQGEAFKAHVDNTQFEIVNTDTHKRIAYLDKDTAQFGPTVVREQLTVQQEKSSAKALRVIPICDGVMFTIND